MLWLFHLVVVVLGFLGGYLAWKLQQTDPYPLHLVMGVVGSLALLHFFLFTALRHQVPIMPFFLVLTAVAIEHVRAVVRDVVPAQAA